ncbi:MAG: hypothetical protein NE328_07200 [Lentisphaeraceae bacterium]|nr:hypothetical protein [Lentisphaeraceae bacterium]
MSRLYKFRHEDTCSFLKELADCKHTSAYDLEKHSFTGTHETKVLWRLRLPLFFPSGVDGEPLWHYLENNSFEDLRESWNILLMESGRAALGTYKNGKIVEHKNIRKYMVRKGQGKSQLTHLKTKGKSRYGSRLRLQESEAFFYEVIERLQNGNCSAAPHIFYHCPATLWPFLMDEAKTQKFDLTKHTWRRLGVSVKECSFDELKRMSEEPLYCRFTLEDESIKDDLPEIPEYRK